MTKARTSYPSDVSDEEWAFSAPYLTLMKEDAPQREYSLRELFNGLRWFVRPRLGLSSAFFMSCTVTSSGLLTGSAGARCDIFVDCQPNRIKSSIGAAYSVVLPDVAPERGLGSCAMVGLQICQP